jgi:hypothetical protein
MAPLMQQLHAAAPVCAFPGRPLQLIGSERIDDMSTVPLSPQQPGPRWSMTNMIALTQAARDAVEKSAAAFGRYILRNLAGMPGA